VITNSAPKPEKPNTGSSTGFLMGLMFSFLIGLAMFKATPKSTRSDYFPYLIGIGVIVSCTIGYQIGAGIDDQNYRDQCLGIDRITTKPVQNEEQWGVESYWKQYDGYEHRILTTKLDGEMVTIYNQSVIATHGYASKSLSLTKIHEEVKNDIVGRLKEGWEG
jgi:hypothetical protein